MSRYSFMSSFRTIYFPSKDNATVCFSLYIRKFSHFDYYSFFQFSISLWKIQLSQTHHTRPHHHHHHHHQGVLTIQISFSLTIRPDRQPHFEISSRVCKELTDQYWCVHWRMSLMGSSLHSQQYPTCPVRLYWMICEIGGNWPITAVLWGVASKICSEQHTALLVMVLSNFFSSVMCHVDWGIYIVNWITMTRKSGEHLRTTYGNILKRSRTGVSPSDCLVS